MYRIQEYFEYQDALRILKSNGTVILIVSSCIGYLFEIVFLMEFLPYSIESLGLLVLPISWVFPNWISYSSGIFLRIWSIIGSCHSSFIEEVDPSNSPWGPPVSPLFIKTFNSCFERLRSSIA
ncbi:hypothetical protein H5410_045350 [Solanum commersonii]|uniref:Uncharacterized protein n=1 Tax=Solanum commersonii TaxID=4109 RepID=A0A9J5XCH1_SOLCO|nr:hypothetical protein H5410_045350 [Solanum commersonii]